MIRYESLDLGERESSFDHTLYSHSGRCDRVSHNRAPRAYARGLLGRDRDFSRDAIDTRRDSNAR